MNYFVTAIGTDSGKTITSAILCEALAADYWKPIQAGFPKDSDTVKSLSEKTIIHKEAFVLNTPASPHAAARIDGVEIKLAEILAPNTDRDLVIEGAGGCLVPVNDHEFVIDICSYINCRIILVSNLYLGSINHTLLTVNLLKQRKYNVHGIIFNGPSNPASEEIILKHSGYIPLLHIPQEPIMTSELIKKYASVLKNNWR